MDMEEKLRRRANLGGYVERPNIALAPLRWNLKKLEDDFEQRKSSLNQNYDENIKGLKDKQKLEKVKLRKSLKDSKEKLIQTIDVPPRIKRLQQAEQNLKSLGRMSEAEKVKARLKPLEKQFWDKTLEEKGWKDQAKKKIHELEFRQKDKLRSLTKQKEKKIQQVSTNQDKEIKILRRKNEKSSDRIFTLWYAALNNDMERVELLAKRENFRVDERDPDSGQTALQMAARNDHEQILRKLLSLGGNPNRLDPNGCTPLHSGAAYGSRRIVAILLENGADKTIKNKAGETPIDVAKSNLRFQNAELLKWWNPVGHTVEELEKIVESNVDPTERILDQCKDPEAKIQLQILTMKEKQYGRHHPGLAKTLVKLGKIYKERSNLEQAVEAYTRAVQILQQSSQNQEVEKIQRKTADMFELARILTVLGKDCFDLGRGNDAEKWFLEGIKILKTVPGRSSELLQEPLFKNLGLYYLSVRRLPEASSKLQQYVRLKEKSYVDDMGQAALNLIAPLDYLGFAYTEQGLFFKALEVYQRSMDIVIDHKGNQCPEIAKRLEKIAQVHFLNREYKAAHDIFIEAQKHLQNCSAGNEFDEELMNLTNNIAVATCKMAELEGVLI